MLRALVALLLVANLAFFGWARGWFAPTWPAPRDNEREPGRLAAQVRPDALAVLPPKAASDAVTAAREAAALCMEAGPVNDTDLPAAEAVLTAASLTEGGWQREAAPPAALWLVFAGRVAEPTARRAREEELRKLDLAFEVIDTPADLAPGLVLSRHATRAAAEAAMATLSATDSRTPVKGLRVVSLPPPPPQTWLRVPRADAELQTRLRALPTTSLAGGFKACTPR